MYVNGSVQELDSEYISGLQRFMPEAMFFYATVIKTEDEFCLIKKSNEDSQRGHLGTALKVAQPNFKPAPMVLIAPKHILWSG